MKSTRIFILILSLIISNLSASIMGESLRFGVVNQSVINLRVTPKFSAEMSSQALLGTPVRILNENHGWYKLVTPEGYNSWATTESVKQMTTEEFENWNKSAKLIVRSYFTVLRAKPSENSEVLSDVVLGDIIINKGKFGKYFIVQLPDNRIGYLLKSSAIPLTDWLTSHLPSAKNIISMAKNFIGFPYLWGGTSVKGMDCSGFTKTCFYLNGVILPRDASQQAQTGESIDISNNFKFLQPADLLFFGSKVEGKEHVSHVAIYIGNGDFIHSSGTVHISSLLPTSSRYDAFNTNRLLRAQRILTRIDLDSTIISIKKHPFYQ